MSVRDLKGCSKALFKAGLDRFLKEVPDEPQIPSYVTTQRAETNSIPDMVRFTTAK